MALASLQEEKKTAVLLVNLGSPDSPTRSGLRRYLREFLSDPRVVKIPRFVWWIILNFLILPLRPAKSAKAYRKIWTEKGSPLIIETTQLAKQLADKLGQGVTVEVAMRYGEPAMHRGLNSLKQAKIHKLIVLPLYPQYSETTTASVFDQLFALLKSWEQIPTLTFINDYHQNAAYIKAVADSIIAFWQKQGRGEVLLMSFHGLPARSIKSGDPYFYQCHMTASLIADELKLDKQQWRIVFQSRFGKAEWLKPYCVETLRQLPGEGITHIDVVCPGFPVDCLETLEEIVITNKQIFLHSGGHRYQYIPALNASRLHAEVLIDIINENSVGITDMNS